ncbi:MAG: hypothetical protein ACFB50_04765 [Rubrobacteraceae bacterium]
MQVIFVVVYLAGIVAGGLAGLIGVLELVSYGAVPEIVAGGLVSLVFYGGVSFLTKPPPTTRTTDSPRVR